MTNIDWSKIKTASGTAANMPKAFEYLKSKSLEERKKGYWLIDNHAVLQSDLYEATVSYVRLTRKNLDDISPVMKLIEFGKLSVLSGATASLTFDSVIPKDDDIKSIIKKIDSFEESKIYKIGVFSPIGYLISAMYMWKKNLLQTILKNML